MFRTFTPGLWTLVAIAVPLAWLMNKKSTYNASTNVSYVVAAGSDGTKQQQQPGHDVCSNNDKDGIPTLPPEVLERPEEWVVARERVISKPLPLANLRSDFVGRETPHDLIRAYMRTTMSLFSRTPQAWFMRWVIKDADVRSTFDEGYLRKCKFEIEDRVCGVYVVTSKHRLENTTISDKIGGEMVVLSLSPPSGWTGPIVRGRLVIGCRRAEESIQLVNETVLWRHRDEKPVLIEGALGRWMHTLMVQWMVLRGIEAVMTSRTSDN